MSVLYNTIGVGYSNYRKPDTRIAALILDALGDAATMLNVGAGTGSYEPRDREVTAIEPSATMIAQRPADAAPCLQGSAEALPFDNNSFDAALAILTVHHWPNQRRGMAEMARVARRRCVFLTWEVPEREFWLTRDYFPQIIEHDRATFSMTPYRDIFGTVSVLPVPVPHDCTDGFLCAYWRRPHAYLDPDVRLAISSFARLGDVSAMLDRLRQDLDDDTWMRRNGALMREAEMDFGYRLVIAEIGD